MARRSRSAASAVLAALLGAGAAFPPEAAAAVRGLSLPSAPRPVSLALPALAALPAPAMPPALNTLLSPAKAAVAAADVAAAAVPARAAAGAAAGSAAGAALSSIDARSKSADAPGKRDPSWSSAAWARLLGWRAPERGAEEAPVVAAPAGTGGGGPRLEPPSRALRRAADIMLRGDPEVRPFLKKHRAGIAATSGLMVFSGAGQILQTKLLGLLIDAALARHGTQAAEVFGAYLATHLFFVFVDLAREKKMQWIRLSFTHDVRSALFEKLSAGGDILARHPPSEASARLLNDVAQLQTRNINARVSLPYNLAMLAMSAAVMLQTSLSLTLAAGALSPVIVWLFLKYGRTQQRNEGAFVAARAAAAQAGEAGLSAREEAQSLGPAARRRQAARYAAASDRMARSAFRKGVSALNYDYGIGFINHFAAHFLVYGLGLLSYIRTGAPSVGQITSLAGYADSLRSSAQGLLYVVKDYKAAEGQTRTLLDWLREPAPAAARAAAADPLERVSAALGPVAPGESVGVEEASGASLDALASSLAGPGAARLDARSSWLPGTVAENLRDARPAATDAELAAALRKADAAFLLEPGALELSVEEAAKRFGAGALRRGLLARLMLQDPRLVVLSAPEDDLAGRDRVRFEAALDRVLAGRTAVWLYPEPERAARLARRITLGR